MLIRKISFLFYLVARAALFAENPVELRLLFESHIRDRGDSSSLLAYILVYHNSDDTLPYDIEKKCRYRSITLSALFPLLDEDVIRDLSMKIYHNYWIWSSNRPTNGSCSSM